MYNEIVFKQMIENTIYSMSQLMAALELISHPMLQLGYSNRYSICMVPYVHMYLVQNSFLLLDTAGFLV